MKQDEFTGDVSLNDLIRKPKDTSCIYTLGEGFKASDFQPMAYGYASRVGAKFKFETRSGTFSDPFVQVKVTLTKAAIKSRIIRGRGAPKGMRAETKENLKKVEALLKKNYSQAEVGRELGCSREYVRQLVNKM